jgi:epoxyqueuosine reductase QueG
MNSQQLTKEIRDEIFRRGAKLSGIAPIDRFEGSPAGHHPRDYVAKAQSVIVVVIPIASGLMNWNSFMENSDMVPEKEIYKKPGGVEQPWSPRVTLRKHIERRCSYEVVNMELQTISMHVSILLEDYGYRSVYLPTTYGMTLSWPGNYIWDFPKMKSAGGPFSHRHAAVAAGLGLIGRNNLFMTPKHGPRVRLVSVITEAELVPDSQIEEPICLGEKCNQCVKACPSGAFSKDHIIEYKVGSSLQRVCAMDKEKCRNYYKDSAYGTQCGRECMTACPLSRRLPQPGLNS